MTFYGKMDAPAKLMEMRNEAEDAGIPIIECRYGRTRPGENRIWKFHCSYCRTEHIHGADEGHRNAHCTNPDSPYRRTGYYLVHESSGVGRMG